MPSTKQQLQPQKQQQSQVLTPATITLNPVLKAPVLKDVNDGRLQIVSTNFSQASQPSLVNSAPMSQTTLAGVNAPPLTTTVNLAIVQSGIGTQSTLFQQLSQSREIVVSYFLIKTMSLIGILKTCIF